MIHYFSSEQPSDKCVEFGPEEGIMFGDEAISFRVKDETITFKVKDDNGNNETELDTEDEVWGQWGDFQQAHDSGDDQTHAENELMLNQEDDSRSKVKDGGEGQEQCQDEASSGQAIRSVVL